MLVKTKTCFCVAVLFGFLTHSSFTMASWHVGKKTSAEQKLLEAVYEENEKMVDEALQEGANPNAMDLNGVTALSMSARQGAKNLVKTLLNAKAEVNPRHTYPGWSLSALHEASKKNHVEVARLLLRHGANPNRRDHMNYTPLHRGAPFKEVTSLLLEAKANPEVHGNDGYTPMHLATQAFDAQSLHLLMRASDGSTINTKTKEKERSPLHEAIRVGNGEAVFALLEAGADKKAKDHKGETAKALAKRKYEEAETKIEKARLKMILELFK